LNISIFGLGYIGTISVGCLAKSNHHVCGVDVNSIKVEFINTGKSPIVEKEIDNILFEQRRKNRIEATTDCSKAICNSDVSFICVGTPPTPNGHLNLEGVYKVAKEIGCALKNKDSFHVIAIRSTVMPGTNERVAHIIEDLSGKEKDVDFSVVSNPEFLREGTAVHDFYNPPYTLVGSSCEKAVSILQEVYNEIKAPFIHTEIEVAELIKYVNNAFHALKITFANEIGNICKKMGINSFELMDIFCKDDKLNISSKYLKPGFAFGGSCLPKDLKALNTIAHDFYLESPVLDSILKSNELQKEIVLNKIIDFGKPRIGFLGLAFKEDTDDLRCSPIVDVIEKLIGKGFEITIYDKNVHLANLMGANKDYIMSKIPYISKFITDKPEDIIANVDVVVVVNNEKEFIKILDSLPGNTIIYDLVNVSFQNKISINQNYTGIAWK